MNSTLSFDKLVEKAVDLIKEYNQNLQKTQPNLFIEEKDFRLNLASLGAFNNSTLGDLSYEDIIDCLILYEKERPNGVFGIDTPGPYLVENALKPKFLAKSIANLFRTNTGDLRKELLNSATPKYKLPELAEGYSFPPKESDVILKPTTKKVEHYSLRELVNNFDPTDVACKLAKRLFDLSRGESFIVYSSGRTVNTEATLKLLIEVKEGHSGRSIYIIDSVPYQVYKVGDIPENLVDENPIWHRALKPDGTCDQTLRSWEGVPLRLRQLIRVIVNTDITHPITTQQAHDLIDIVLSGAIEPDLTFKKIAVRYPKSALAFKELEKLGQLPSLKINITPVKVPSVGGFPAGKTVNQQPTRWNR